MSVHEGVRCDVCGKNNFPSKRFKCLICYDYDLCSTCREQDKTSNDHTIEHPMQCILTHEDFNLYYYGENCASNQVQSFTCPYCGEMGLAHPFPPRSSLSNNSTASVDLFQHLQVKHTDDQQATEVLCPICATTIGGEPNLATSDLISHIANEHQYPPVTTPSSTDGETSLTARQILARRDYDFGVGSGVRGSFRRGLVRGFGRRGGGGLGRSDEPASQHFLVDPSTGIPLAGGGNDSVADILTHLSAARRLIAASSDGGRSSTSSPNVINLQNLTRHQLERERERLRITGRLHQHSSQQTRQSTSNATPAEENNFFLSLLSSDHLIDPYSSSSSSQSTWGVEQERSNPSSTTKSPAITSTEPSPSLLRRMCEDSSSLCSVQQNVNTTRSCRQKSDFVQCLLLSIFSHSPAEQ